MNTVIYKYNLKLTDRQTLNLPDSATLLTVQEQNGILCLWALVNPKFPLEPRIIEILGTGNLVPVAQRKYISTVQTNQGSLVWHVFEIIS